MQNIFRSNKVFINNGKPIVTNFITNNTSALSKQENNEHPIICLLLDISGSMRNLNKLQHMLQFIYKLANVADENTILTLIIFNDSPLTLIQGSPKDEFIKQFNNLRSIINASGQTSIILSIKFALNEIGKLLKFHNRSNAILVEMTDGQGNNYEDDIFNKYENSNDSILCHNLDESFKYFNECFPNKILDCVFIEPTTLDDTAPVEEYAKRGRLYQRVPLTGNYETDLAEINLMNSIISDCVMIAPKLKSCSITWKPSVSQIIENKMEIWELTSNGIKISLLKPFIETELNTSLKTGKAVFCINNFYDNPQSILIHLETNLNKFDHIESINSSDIKFNQPFLSTPINDKKTCSDVVRILSALNITSSISHEKFLECLNTTLDKYSQTNDDIICCKMFNRLESDNIGYENLIDGIKTSNAYNINRSSPPPSPIISKKCLAPTQILTQFNQNISYPSTNQIARPISPPFLTQGNNSSVSENYGLVGANNTTQLVNSLLFPHHMTTLSKTIQFNDLTTTQPPLSPPLSTSVIPSLTQPLTQPLYTPQTNQTPN